MANNRLREVRISKGMTQTELARKSGVSRVTIWAIESDDEYSVKTKTLEALATALGVTVDTFFRPTD